MVKLQTKLDMADDIRSSMLKTLSSGNLKTAGFVSAIVRLIPKGKPSLSYQRCLTTFFNG
jgi:hypothetical protein